jgi:hypothetical protein
LRARNLAAKGIQFLGVGVSGGEEGARHGPSIMPGGPNNREEKVTGQLNIYCEAVIASIRDADSILLFGPGEAEGELEKRLESGRLEGRLVGVEATDKITERQIAAKVRQRFRS